MNIVIRSFLYLAQSYKEYFDETGQSLYSSKRAKMPEPELYVIFTGERIHKPEELSLAEEFFGGKDCAIEIKVKVIYGDEEENIINQYILFIKIYNEQMKLHGRTEKAITETIRICKDRNVLREYLESREKEVHDIMFSLFDDEYIMKMFLISEHKRVEEETTERVKIEDKKEAEEKAIKTAEKLLKSGKLSAEEISECVSDISLEKVKELEEKLKQNI